MAIQQKLHTKLVQKLILTPSLQQAIKLLPMSTLELADLLNQEMVENPLLEEVPTEELQPAEQTAEREAPRTGDRPKNQTPWDDADYEYFFGDYLEDNYRSRTPAEVKELPPIENTLSTGTSLADHLMWQLSLQTEDEKLQGDRQRHHRQSRRRWISRRVGRGDRRDGGVARQRRRARAAARPDVRSDRRRRQRPAGMPVAPDPASQSGRHADREDRHRAPAAPAEPSGARRLPAGWA